MTDKSNSENLYVGPMVSSIIDGIVKEFKKPKNKEKIINNVIDPLVYEITSRYYSYFMTIVIVLVIMILLLLSIFVLSISNRVSKPPVITIDAPVLT